MNQYQIDFCYMYYLRDILCNFKRNFDVTMFKNISVNEICFLRENCNNLLNCFNKLLGNFCPCNSCTNLNISKCVLNSCKYRSSNSRDDDMETMANYSKEYLNGNNPFNQMKFDERCILFNSNRLPSKCSCNQCHSTSNDNVSDEFSNAHYHPDSKSDNAESGHRNFANCYFSNNNQNIENRFDFADLRNFSVSFCSLCGLRIVRNETYAWQPDFCSCRKFSSQFSEQISSRYGNGSNPKCDKEINNNFLLHKSAANKPYQTVKFISDFSPNSNTSGFRKSNEPKFHNVIPERQNITLPLESDNVTKTSASNKTKLIEIDRISAPVLSKTHSVYPSSKVSFGFSSNPGMIYNAQKYNFNAKSNDMDSHLKSTADSTNTVNENSRRTNLPFASKSPPKSVLQTNKSRINHVKVKSRDFTNPEIMVLKEALASKWKFIFQNHKEPKHVRAHRITCEMRKLKAVDSLKHLIPNIYRVFYRAGHLQIEETMCSCSHRELPLTLYQHGLLPIPNAGSELQPAPAVLSDFLFANFLHLTDVTLLNNIKYKDAFLNKQLSSLNSTGKLPGCFSQRQATFINGKLFLKKTNASPVTKVELVSLKELGKLLRKFPVLQNFLLHHPEAESNAINAVIEKLQLDSKFPISISHRNNGFYRTTTSVPLSPRSTIPDFNWNLGDIDIFEVAKSCDFIKTASDLSDDFDRMSNLIFRLNIENIPHQNKHKCLSPLQYSMNFIRNCAILILGLPNLQKLNIAENYVEMAVRILSMRPSSTPIHNLITENLNIIRSTLSNSILFPESITLENSPRQIPLPLTPSIEVPCQFTQSLNIASTVTANNISSDESQNITDIITVNNDEHTILSDNTATDVSSVSRISRNKIRSPPFLRKRSGRFRKQPRQEIKP